MILGDTPAFVMMSLICLVFCIHVILISFHSTISLIADISTSNRFSKVCFKVWAASYRLWLSVYAMMFNYFPSWNNNSNTNLFIYIVTSHPSERDNVSVAMVVLLLFWFWKNSNKVGMCCFCHLLKRLSDQLGCLHWVSC